MSGCPFKSLLGNEKGALSFLKGTKKQESPAADRTSASPASRASASGDAGNSYRELLASTEASKVQFVGLQEADIRRLVSVRPIFEKNNISLKHFMDR